MKPVHPRHGIPGPPGDEDRRIGPPLRPLGGFTLLEMCIVLFIIALLFGVTMPAMHSAFTEQAVRKDAHQLALMVKTAMIQSGEQNRAYVIDLTSTTMALHPFGVDPADADDPTAESDDDTPSTSTLTNVELTTKLDPANKLLAPDPQKPDAWVEMPATTWVFQPGELCPATQVRVKRGDSWLDMSFAALTGNVDQEGDSFP
jgi:type II secretory pathway pseudopilin PulG